MPDRIARADEPFRLAPGLPDPAGLPLVLQFMQALWAVSHGLERVSKRMSADLGVTGPQRLVLRVVGLFPGVSPGDLARILHVHPSTLTGVLQRLVAQRLLGRVDDAHDRRRAILHLTARGLAANAASRGTVEAAVADALAALSDRDRAVARRVLAEVARHLDGAAASPSKTARSSRAPRVRPSGRPARG